MKCSDCKYFHAKGQDAVGGGTLGECRRYAPRAKARVFLLHWPEVNGEKDWCGEWEECDEGATCCHEYPLTQKGVCMNCGHEVKP